MIEIFYKINYQDNLISEDDLKQSLITNINNFRQKLLDDNWGGNYGVFYIHFYNYEFVIDTEMIWSMLFRIHCSGIGTLLMGENYKCNFESLENDYMTLDFVDTNNNGIRMRLFGEKTYKDDKGNLLYVSRTDYMKQEIILPKWAYMEKLLSCADRFIAYRELLNLDPKNHHLDYWKNKVQELKAKVDNLKPS